MKIIILLLAAWISIVAYNHLFRPDVWSGMYVNSSGAPVKAMDFQSKDECLGWIKKNNTNGTDYECGSNCKLSSSQAYYVCDETVNQMNRSDAFWPLVFLFFVIWGFVWLIQQHQESEKWKGYYACVYIANEAHNYTPQTPSECKRLYVDN